MADAKISQLPASTTPLAGTESVPIVQSSTTKKVSVDNLTTGKYVPANGVTFPASQVASADVNTLDDYEEGSFTPTDASGASLVFSSKDGKYTKIGRLVSIQMQVVYPSTADTSAAKIGGLPFNAASSPTAQGAAFGYTNGSGAAALLVNASTAYIEVYNTAGAAVTNANLSTKYNYISFCYITST